MNFEEYAAKPLLKAAGILIPRGKIAGTADEAEAIAAELGASVIKAQVPTGKRGKSGGIALCQTQGEAREAALRILGMNIGEHTVRQILVEEQVPIAKEFYAAVLNDAASKGPLLLFSSEGGMDIEEIAESHPDKLVRVSIDIRKGLDRGALSEALPAIDGLSSTTLSEALSHLYSVYTDNDAELVEINPLVLTDDGTLIALDCKFVLDDSGIKRQQNLSESGTPETLTAAETHAKDIGFRYIELDGNVGVLANGAGLTMTSMDAVRHFGGKPANFLEIGGEAYRLGKEALEIILAKPGIKSLLINFCGAFARTDVMVEGIVTAWKEINPSIPIFFTIHGTGAAEAVAMVKDQLDIEPYELMDDAVRAAVEAAR
ncbi:succinate--CoA ligase [GDP-forming] subunit beta [bacterium MnTg02]|nr:succinate--CoA ligase [GDP-forming] subunit beta [bacterium MnTg02]